ncbi:hypothetical protein SmphiM6_17 [Sinorhizobium phage phiM6]|nr:hypothetical protein SmphiM6_17 [Sinorhizobium phage phiM6]
MAGSTFLVLTNKLLRRLNEVQLTDTSFASARNVQAMAKDAVLAAIAEINIREYQWPWNKTQGTAVANVGTTEFTWATDTAVPLWDSFKITGVPADAIVSSYLAPITQEQWFKEFRQIDVDSIPDGGKEKPRFIYPTVGGFGVTPMPEQAYTITYEYYTIPTELVTNDETCSIPSAYDYVIINFALKHYYMYKDNTQQATVWSQEAETTFKQMKYRTATNRPDAAWSNVVNFGGMNWKSDYTQI